MDTIIMSIDEIGISYLPSYPAIFTRPDMARIIRAMTNDEIKI